MHTCNVLWREQGSHKRGRFQCIQCSSHFSLLCSAPKPQTFTPTLDQLRVVAKLKDAAIDKRLHPVFQTPTEMPAEEEAEVKRLLSNPGFASTIGREQVKSHDMVRLRPGQWLNDEIINFYGQLILTSSEGAKGAKGPSKPLNAHYFNTFFWPKLTGDGYQKGRLGKWTKKVIVCVCGNLTFVSLTTRICRSISSRKTSFQSR